MRIDQTMKSAASGKGRNGGGRCGRLLLAVLLTAILVMPTLLTPYVSYGAPNQTAIEDAKDLPLFSNVNYYTKFQGQGVTLNVYNWGEYISDGADGTLDVNKVFEALTGIQVNYTNYATNEEMYAKMKSGGANYDVIFPSDYMVGRMVNEGMLEELDHSKIPLLSNIDPEFVNSNYDPGCKYSVPYTWGTVGLIYNTDMVKEEVDSWDILWDEKYSNNLLMFGNSRDAFGISLKRLGYSLNTTDPSELAKAADELKKQKPLVMAYVMDEIFDKMEGNEAAVAPYYAGDAYNMMKENDKLAFAVPKEGTNIFLDAVCIPKGTKYKEAAEMYINFLCEPEVAAANIELIGYSTPNLPALILLDPEIRGSEIIYPSEDVKGKAEQFLALPDATNRLMDQLWSEIRSDESGFVQWGLAPVTVVVLICAFKVASKYKKKKKRQAMVE